MRLKKLVIAGFRGFAEEAEFDLDADVILVSGPNGAGKTSFFDAILWGLTGSVARVGPNDAIVNRFSSFGDARVEVHLTDEAGSEVEVVRRFDGSESLSVKRGEERRSGTTAQAVILEALWPDGQGSSDPVVSFAQSLTKSVYLEQDRVSHFVEADDEQQRFDVVGEIVGAGRLGELSRQLESGRRAWTRATNRLSEEFEPTGRRLRQIESRLSEISGGEELRAVESVWRDWVDAVAAQGEPADVEVTPERRAAELDSLLDRLARRQRATESEVGAVQRLQILVAEPPIVPDAPPELEGTLATLTEQVQAASVDLRKAEAAASEARRERLAEVDDRQSLGALAQLALRHLGDECPVCTQSYDRAATTDRLRHLVDAADLAPEIHEDGVLLQAADRLRDLEESLADAEAATREMELSSRRRRDWEAQVASLVSEAGFPEGEIPDSDLLVSEIERRRQRVGELRQLRDAGEEISVSLARLAEAAEAETLRGELRNLQSAVSAHESEMSKRQQAANNAEQLHEAIRSISESFVVDELTRIEPLLQRIYATVDPHPAFRAVRFLTKMHRGRGRLWTAVEASAGDEAITVDEPRTVLSSSQLNVLALSAFLALNLSVPTPPLSTIALDDPLQSLDDVNLLGLSDLLRRLRSQRQVILSTHDHRLANLLERKLRPVEAGERTVSISMTGWDRSGPRIDFADVPRGDSELRLVSA